MKRRTLRDGIRLVGEYEQSGEGRRSFCSRRGLSVGTLDYWRRRIAGAGAGSLVEVEVRPGARMEPSPGSMTITWPCGVRVEMEAREASGGWLRGAHEVFGGGSACLR
ncbi:MAG: IS66 family insertion sequence element accessory protein TnpA [Verrucomicrobiales bacterium]